MAGNAAARRPPLPLRKREPLSWAGQDKAVPPCGSLENREKTWNALKSKWASECMHTHRHTHKHTSPPQLINSWHLCFYPWTCQRKTTKWVSAHFPQTLACYPFAWGQTPVKPSVPEVGGTEVQFPKVGLGPWGWGWAPHFYPLVPDPYSHLLET